MSGTIVRFIDPASFVFIVLTVGLFITATGMWPDLKRGFKATFSKVLIYTKSELRKSEIALKMTMTILFLAGLLATLVGTVAVFANDVEDNFLKYMSVALLTTLYSWIINMMLLPIYFKLKSLIIDAED
jgi:flagellar motor component MotA